jgi:hypothetical protein
MDVQANGVLAPSQVFDQALAHFLASNEVGIVSVSLTAIVNIIKNILSVRHLILKSSTEISILVSSPQATLHPTFA